MADQGLLPADALEKNAPRVIPPLAGFWFRLGAIVLDVFLLRLVLQASIAVLGPFYSRLGSGSVLFGLAVAYLYLVLAEARFGKGMTVGKAVLGIRTTDLNGDPPSPKTVAVRSAVLLVVALPFLSGHLTKYLLANGRPPSHLVLPVVLQSLGWAYIMANVFLVILHPLKQAVHDSAAGTLVVREAGAHNLSAYLGKVAEQGETIQRRAVQIALLSFAGLGLLFSIQAFKGWFSEESKRQIGAMQSFQEEFSFGPFRAQYRESVFPIDALTSITQATPDVIQAGMGDNPATTTHILEVGFVANSEVTEEDLGTSETLRDLKERVASWFAERLRENQYPFDRKTRLQILQPQRGKRPGDDDDRDALPFQPRFVAMVFIQETHLLFCSKGERLGARVELQPIPLPKGFYEDELQAKNTGSPESKRPAEGGDKAPAP